MEETDVGGLDAGLTAQSVAGGSSEETSLLDALAAQVQKTSDDQETFVPIPGYEKSGMTLLARYMLLDSKESEKIGRRVMREFKSKSQQYERNLYASVDVMVAACTGIFVERSGERIQLTFQHREISGYSDDLVSALKLTVAETSPVRSTVFQVFRSNVYAIQQHSLLLGRWMSNTTTDVLGEVLDAGGNL